MSTRRAFVRGAAAAAAALPLLHLPRSGRASEVATVTGRPRALVQFHLYGGIDPVMSTDPKHASEVEPEIDVPYAPAAMRTVSGRRFGPAFAPLERYLPEMAILNGVRGSTVSHITGTIQTVEMRRSYPPTMRGLGGTLGDRLARTPLSDCRLVKYNPVFTSLPPAAGRSLSYNLFMHPDSSVLNRLSVLATDGVRRRATLAGLDAELGRASASDRPSLTAVRELVAGMADRPVPALPGAQMPAYWKLALRDTLYLLEHSLTTSVFLSGCFFDSHEHNYPEQLEEMADFAPALSYFLDALARTKTADGVLLSEQVAVVVCSELGKFPILNNAQGKDHLPEFPVLFFGPGVRPGTYGETDRRMLATPISAATGRASSSARDLAPTLDDVGTTILSWFGIDDAASLGYLGKRLDFLLG